MTFKTIHTNYGLARMAAAEVSGTPINLTHMAVGDGNGNPTTPNPAQTSLVREMYRHTVNRVYQYPGEPARYAAELVVPATEGGFTLREVAVFDDVGSMFAVGNLPDTYKPTNAEGAFSDCIVRLEFLVSSAGVVTLLIDPNVTVATQTWIINNVTPASLIPGGTTHQVLRKHSNANGDFEWADPSEAGIVVDMIEETQTLAASQTAVTLSTVTTNGLAIYIEGVRLRSNQWTAVDATHLTLAASYPAGTKLQAIQNEPAGSVVFPLAQSLNLSDVPDKALARTNLDVFSKSESRQLAPAGQVSFFARNTAPAGWLKANGAAVSRTAYADLFAAVGTLFGAGDGFNTFNLPDLRGEFLRGWDDGRGVDSGRAFGSAQADELRSHAHAISTSGTDQSSSGYISDASSPNINVASTQATGGTETRPRNVVMLACIKY